MYGSDRDLRLWLERVGVAHVLAIKCNEKLWACMETGPKQVRADRLASQVDETGWKRLNGGNGAKGPLVYDWAAVDIQPLRKSDKGYWLLARRSVSQPEELAKVAGSRWATLECFEEAKGQVGLDQYEVRKWDSWYRHITLAMLAYVYLSMVRLGQSRLNKGLKIV